MSYVLELFFHSKKYFGENTVAVTSFLKFSQPAAGDKTFGENTVTETSFRDEEKKRSLRQKNWKFNCFLKNEKNKTIPVVPN